MSSSRATLPASCVTPLGPTSSSYTCLAAMNAPRRLSRNSSSVSAASTYGLAVPAAVRILPVDVAMAFTSFPYGSPRVYCRPRTLVVITAILVVAVAALSGCGGSSGPQEGSTQTVSGPGFTFKAPGGRQIARTQRSVSVLPPEQGSPELISVTRFPLLRRFRPALWPGAVVELDGVADRLVRSLHGKLESGETVRLHGLRGRRYEISFEKGGKALRQRLVFLLKGKTEYQLLCRWDQGGSEPAACGVLEESFRPA